VDWNGPVNKSESELKRTEMKCGLGWTSNCNGLWTGVDRSGRERTMDQSGKWTEQWTGVNHGNCNGVYQLK